MLDQCYSDKWTRPKWTEEIIIIIIIKKQPSFYLWLSGPGDVQVRPLTRPSTVSVHILASKAQETVHTQVQASFTFLRRQQGDDDDDDDVRNCLYLRHQNTTKQFHFEGRTVEVSNPGKNMLIQPWVDFSSRDFIKLKILLHFCSIKLKSL